MILGIAVSERAQKFIEDLKAEGDYCYFVRAAYLARPGATPARTYVRYIIVTHCYMILEYYVILS